VNHALARHRFLRARLWLASAMWVPVLAANVVAVVLALALPVVDEHLGEEGSPPIAVGAAQQIFGALAAGMITFTGIIFSRCSSLRRSRRPPTHPGSRRGCVAIPS
jgi:uncharacterized membrane protein